MRFLTTIDRQVLNTFYSVKSFFYFEKIKNILFFIKPYFFSFISKIDNIICLKYPNLHKLVNDILYVCRSNKEFILYCIRIYLYLTILLYIITFSFLTIILFTESKNLVYLGELLARVYNFWTLPIKRIRFLIKYLFIIPFKLLNFILYPITYRPKNTTAECMSSKEENKDFGKSPKQGRDTSLDATEWELNCMRNKTEKTLTSIDLLNKLRHAAHQTSFFMDQDIRKTAKPFSKSYENFTNKLEDIDNTHRCPKHYEKEQWNRSFDKRR